MKNTIKPNQTFIWEKKVIAIVTGKYTKPKKESFIQETLRMARLEREYKALLDHGMTQEEAMEIKG